MSVLGDLQVKQNVTEAKVDLTDADKLAELLKKMLRQELERPRAPETKTRDGQCQHVWLEQPGGWERCGLCGEGQDGDEPTRWAES